MALKRARRGRRKVEGTLLAKKLIAPQQTGNDI
jgi:hypothetical protein